MADLAYLGFSVDTKGLKKGERALNSYAKTGDKAEKSTDKNATGITNSYKKVAGAIGLVTSAFLSLNKLVSVSREFDVLNAQLITATGGAENAAKAFDAINKFASETPFNLAQVTSSFVKLVNLGLTPSERALTSYGNTASAMGKDLNQLIEAVADASTNEFERLKEFGIKAKQEGENVSLTFRGITTTVKKEAAAIEGYLISLGENEFAGAMQNRVNTLDGAISNLGDAWDNLFLTVSTSGVSSLMEGGVRTATGAIQDLTDLIGSSVLVNRVIALGGLFDGFAKDVANAFDLASMIINESSRGWIKDTKTFFSTFGEAFANIPAMVRFAIQATTVSLASLVDYIGVFGSAAVDILSLRFQKMIDKAKITGQAIGAALNPFADEFDYQGALSDLASGYDALEDGVVASMVARRDAITDAHDTTLMQFAIEGSATTDLFETRLKESDILLAQYKRERAARKGDVLAGFGVVVDPAAAAAASAAKAAAQYSLWISKIEKSTGTLANLQSEVEKVRLAMELGDLDELAGLKYLDQLEDKIKALGKTMSGMDLFSSVTDSIKTSISAMQDMSTEGSKEFKTLGIAIQAVNAIQAVGAVINQGFGDPYTAFARMAAMAGAMASLGQSIGSFGGGIEDQSAANQASQGVNSFGEKSESISRAIETTASATDKLVGINTGMLKALESLQAGISGAAGISARGITGATFDTAGMDSVVDNIFESISGSIFTGLFGFVDTLSFGLFSGVFNSIGKFFGGSSSVTDEGIKILGGTMADLIDGASVFAFQLTSAKKHRWSSSHDYMNEVFIEDASTQFRLVFDSLADSVFEGGIALGLSGKSLEASINRFNIATTKISLKGLSVEQQQAEIEAVFSKIFNNLAKSVIPFIGQFQRTGEELGETLSRVATQVQITEVAAERLGFTLFNKLANPRLFAQIADNLATLTGGVEEFAAKTASFIDDFAPDSVKFSIASDALTESLEEVGLVVPSSADAFFELMKGIDGSTAAGQEQIATILNIQGVAKEYYDLLEDSSTNSLSSLSSSLRGLIDGINDVGVAAIGMSLDAALSAARVGDFSKALALDLNKLMPNKSDFSSLVDFQIEQAVTANKIAELADLAGGETSIEQMMLNESQEQTALLTSINSNYIPQDTQSTNNVIMLDEMRLMIQDVAKIKDATIATAKSSASSANQLRKIELDGIDVRIEA